MQLSSQNRWYLGGTVAVLALLWLSSKSQLISMPMESFGEASMSAPSYAPSPLMAVRGKMAQDGFAPGIMMNESAGDTAATVEARVIRNASLSLLVENIQGSIEKIGTYAQEAKGYVEHSNSGEGADGARYGYITLRVPDETFMGTIALVRSEGMRVQDESITAQDVTEQYTDLQAQLNTAKAEEQAYLGLLNRAGSVSDLLQVQRELSQVRSRIESLQGRIQYLENQTDYSTISINLSEDKVVSLPSKPFRFMAIIREAGSALVQVIQGLATALVWLVIVVAPIALVAWGVFMAVKRWRK